MEEHRRPPVQGVDKAKHLKLGERWLHLMGKKEPSVSSKAATGWRITALTPEGSTKHCYKTKEQQKSS